MKNLHLIEEALHLFGIHDEMIIPEATNITGKFIIEDGEIDQIKRMKITIDFEVDLNGK